MEQLITYLDTLGESKARFADRVDLSPGALADLLSGRRQPSPETAVRIEKETGGAVRVEDWARFEPFRHRESLSAGGETNA